MDIGDRNETQSLRGLLAIYQQEKAWEKALDVIKKLEVVTQQSMHVESGHYYCEIAEQAIKKNQIDKAYQAIKLALQTDKASVRANLIFADLEIKHQRYSPAVRALKQIPKQNPEYMQEMIEQLVFCYEKLGNLDECINYLEELIIDHPRTSAIIVIAEQLKEQKSKEDAIDFVSSQLARYPSIRGLNKLISWHLDSASGKVREQLQMLYDITTKFLEKKPIYRCEHCGFSGKLLHWNCPSCKQWGRIKPINGLEGG